ncbi:DUF1775 domain-containing protein [Rhizobium hidalgonense]|uniref:DUF1775 domain-containing protein n=2 Tax=Rhizobium hidalgonense TaxID=1538159 RepID=UPI001FCEC990|nr:DUF1775 domain-containing protein [Rhizobium hidalgonense]
MLSEHRAQPGAVRQDVQGSGRTRLSAKPMPKPGGTVEKVNVACEKSYDLHGRPVKERVGKITSPAAISLTTNITRSFFCAAVAKEMPAKTRGLVLVTQDCTEGAVERLIEIPAAGKSYN